MTTILRLTYSFIAIVTLKVDSTNREQPIFNLGIKLDLCWWNPGLEMIRYVKLFDYTQCNVVKVSQTCDKSLLNIEVYIILFEKHHEVTRTLIGYIYKANTANWLKWDRYIGTLHVMWCDYEKSEQSLNSHFNQIRIQSIISSV